MNIIGISCYYHDSAACLLQNGVIQEALRRKILRIKHDSNFPLHSINYIFNKYNLALNEIDFLYFMKNLF